jgi:hypothetical protein
MFISNLVGCALLALSILTGCAVLADSAYVINSVLSIEIAWILLCSALVGGLVLRIIADPNRAALTLTLSGDALLILGLLAGIALLLATLGFLDIRNVFSLWGLFGGGIATGAVSVYVARRIPQAGFAWVAQSKEDSGKTI